MSKLIKLHKYVFFVVVACYKSIRTVYLLAYLLLCIDFTCVQVFMNVHFCLLTHFKYGEFKSNLFDISLFFSLIHAHSLYHSLRKKTKKTKITNLIYCLSIRFAFYYCSRSHYFTSLCQG